MDEKDLRGGGWRRLAEVSGEERSGERTLVKDNGALEGEWGKVRRGGGGGGLERERGCVYVTEWRLMYF